MSTPTRMDAMRVVDMTIQIVPVLVAFAWLLASVYEIAVGGLLAITMLGLPIIGAFSASSVTVILYTSFYIYTFYQFDYLLAHTRVVVTLAFTILSMVFTSLSFSTTIPFATIYACMLFIIGVILWFYNRKNHFFHFPFSFVVLAIYYALMRIFIIKATPYDYLGSFVTYTIIKYVGVWIWADLYQNRGGLETIKRGG